MSNFFKNQIKVLQNSNPSIVLKPISVGLKPLNPPPPPPNSWDVQF